MPLHGSISWESAAPRATLALVSSRGAWLSMQGRVFRLRKSRAHLDNAEQFCKERVIAGWLGKIGDNGSTNW